MFKLKNDKLIEKDKGFIDDAIIVLINLYHGQIHAELEYIQSGNEIFLKLANELRKDRSELFEEIFGELEGELRCLFGKHLFGFVGGYMELGARCLSAGNFKMGKKYYLKASKYLNEFYQMKGGGK